MPARLDRATASTVITCPDCPTFREIRTDPIAAGNVAARHDREQHNSYAGQRAVTAAIRRRQGLR